MNTTLNQLAILLLIGGLGCVFADRCSAGDGGGAPVAPLPPGASSQPGRVESTTTTATTQPAGQTQPRPLALATTTLSIEIPTLSGSFADRFQYTFHGQATTTTQYHGDFPSPYQGPNSFTADHEVETSYTGTLFTGIAVIPGSEIYFNPEVSAGTGLSSVVGFGDPPNGETPRVSSPEASPVVARLFLRQTFGFGGPPVDVPDGPNQIAGTVDTNRLVVTVGRFAANDIFDNNTYAHDPRSQFTNWGLWEDDAWDYAANTKGYTDGLALEFNRKNYTMRYGIFRPPGVANGGLLDTHWDRAFDQVVEFEQRYTLMNHPGVVRPMGYFNYAHMGDYRDAIDEAVGYPNVIATRSYSHPKYGVGVSAEQEITSDVGLFARAGWNNGQSESWTFTEVDRTASAGISVKGTPWNRPTDVLGIGSVISGLSKDHRDYLAAGGLGFELGDRQLHYAPEEVLEAYYLIGATKNLFLTFDYQFLNHPGYNADRGPVSVGGFRAHFEF
jgi:high affinity Mn2+ porin